MSLIAGLFNEVAVVTPLKIYIHIGDTEYIGVYEKRAKKLSNAYYAVFMEWNEPSSLICVIHISKA